MTKTNKVDLKANWIWNEDNTVRDDKVIFRKTFNISQDVKTAIAYLGVDTKYWLYINGELIVFEGGLFRESLPGCGYVDKIDIAPYLKKGENVMAVLCWYFGNEGRNNIDSTKAGFIFQCEELNLYSDESFYCHRHDGYYATEAPLPSYLYGGYNIGYKGGNEYEKFADIDFDDSSFNPATIYQNQVWGDLYERPIPQVKFDEICECQEVNYQKGSYSAQLPYAMAFIPYIEVNAKGGEVIDIRSDRYEIHGGPGDENHEYRGHRIEYVCKKGINKFESINYIFGEKIIFTCSSTVEFKYIGYRNTGYNTTIVGGFHCDCDVVNKLVEKAARTLYVCMRDNFMDCPDRERGQWIGDVSVQVPQVIFLLSDSSKKLLRKAIFDFINLRKEDVLVGNVPGANFSELPAQSLNAISQWGLIAQYYKYTGDKDVIELAFEPAIKYLKLWDLDESGLVKPRDGGWRWYDHLYNIDEDVLENAWYYSALRFAKEMSQILLNNNYDDFINARMKNIESSFNKTYWNGNVYTSGKVVDDRANALAVLSGLCPCEYYPDVMKVLISVFNSTIYMENYVLIALCEMGYMEEAYKRMVSRYYNLAVNENSTLWEDFYLLGTKNHAWSGAPVVIAYKYFLGVDTKDGFNTFTINPNKSLFKKISASFNAKNGSVSVEINNITNTIHVINNSDSKYIIKE